MRWLHSEQATAWFWFVDMEKERDLLFSDPPPPPIMTHLTLKFMSSSSLNLFFESPSHVHSTFFINALNSDFLSFTSHENTKVSIEVTSRHSKQNLIFPTHKEHEF